jgi:flagellin-like protein
MTPTIPSPRLPDRAISPVLGVVLMVAIVLLLAVVMGSLAMGFEGKLTDPAPSGGFERDYVPTGEDNTNNRPYVVITHEMGRTVDAENIVIKDDSGNTITWNNVWTGGPEVHAGEYVHVDGFDSDGVLDPICEEGDTYWVIVTNDDGDTLVVNRWEAPAPPDVPPGPHDTDGDGIPDWC